MSTLATTIYLLDGIVYHEAALDKLGPHTTGVGCLYIKDFSKMPSTEPSP